MTAPDPGNAEAAPCLTDAEPARVPVLCPRCGADPAVVRGVEDEDLVRAPVPCPVLCPRCGADRAVVLGVAEYGCGRCGASWPLEAGSVLPRPRVGSCPESGG